MKKLTSAIKFAGMLLVLILAFYSINAFTTSTTSANGSSNRLVVENYELKAKYNELQEDYNNIIKNLNKMNYYDDYIYSTINGYEPDTTLFGIKLMVTDFTQLPNDSIFKLVDSQKLALSRMIAFELQDMKYMYENLSMIDAYPNISPIRTRDFIMVSSEYGWRKHPIYKTAMFHEGIDISARVGTPVYATGDGIVDFVMYSKYGYGNRVVIKHPNGYETLYAHLRSDIKVRKGWKVTKGQQIGTVGNTGRSTGPHLHYEVRQNDKLKDPLAFFYTHITEELLANNN